MLVTLYLVHQSYLTLLFFFFNDTATTEIYTLSLHDALPISAQPLSDPPVPLPDRRARQRQPDHRDRIGPPRQHADRQQHMRPAAPRAPRPPRPQPPPDLPSTAHHPQPRVPPPAQPPPAPRTNQPAI